MRSRRSGLVLSILLAAAACGPTHPSPATVPVLVWPSPPEPARVRYIGSLSRPQDIEAPKSWLGRVWEVIAGREEIHLQRPYGVAADRSGRVYVADSAARVVHIFDVNAQKYSAIKQMGKQPFETPIGVAVAPDGSVYVSDSQMRRVGVFDRSGKLLREFGQDLQRPTGLAVSPTGDRVYVVDTRAHQVAIFDPAGRRLGTIGQRGAGAAGFNYPTNVSVDRAGVVYVADTMNFQVKIFAADGQPRGHFGRHGDGSGDFAQPKGIALDSEGHIYVVEGIHDVLQIFDLEGRFLLGIGATGPTPGNFWLPTGLHIDGQDRIYVADSYNNRIQMFQYLRGLP